MDIISHILIGKIISFFDRKTKKASLWAMSFSFLPDLSQIPFYIVLGYENARPFLFPYNSDWSGAKNLHPFLTTLWEIPHSFFFALLVILPIILYFKLPKIAFFAYLLHLAIDIPTHAGEWQIKPFYPLNYVVNGLTDAWAWPILILIVSWSILIFIILLLNIFQKTNKLKNDKFVN